MRVKLQCTERPPHKPIYKIYLPNDVVKQAGLEQGDTVEVKAKSPGVIEVRK